MQLETDFGNADLIHAMQTLDMAGPFRAVSPWELEDERGVRRINATCYSALPFGERHPELMEFVREYFEHNRSKGLPQQSVSPWRAALQHNLITLLARFSPSHADSEILLSNSGAEAVEAAIKFVRGGRPNARYLVNFTAAYHGLTWMALSLTPNHDYQDIFKPLLPDVVTVPFGRIEAVRETIGGLGPKNVAAVIVEPIQGEAGVIIPPLGFLRSLGELCRQHGIFGGGRRNPDGARPYRALVREHRSRPRARHHNACKAAWRRACPHRRDDRPSRVVETNPRRSELWSEH